VLELGSAAAIDVCPQRRHIATTHGTPLLDHFRMTYMCLYAHMYMVRVFLLSRVHPVILRV
jgi:hypothetical protein